MILFLFRDLPTDLLKKEILTKLPLEKCFQLLAYYGLFICPINHPHRAKFVIETIHSLFDNNAWQYRIQSHFPQFNIIPLQKIKGTDWQQEYFNHLKKKRWVDVCMHSKTDPFYNITVNILNNQLPELSPIKSLILNTRKQLAVSDRDLLCMVSTQELLHRLYEEMSLDLEKAPTENKEATLYFFAVLFNQVELLKEQITDPSKSESTMISAAQYGYTKMIELLLQTLPTTTKNLFGTTLHLACFFGHREMITLLMEKGADPLLSADMPPHISLYPEKYTPLQCALLCAAQFGDLNPLKILVKHHVNMKTVPPDIHGPLLSFYLNHAKSYHPSVIKLLLENGAFIEKNNVSDVMKKRDHRSLILLIQYGHKDLVNFVAKEAEDTLDFLLFNHGGLNIKALDQIQWFAFYVPIEKMQNLLNKPRTLQTPSPLQDALEQTDTRSLKFLLHMGVDLNLDHPRPLRKQPSPAHEKLLNYTKIMRNAKSPKKSALGLLKNARLQFYPPSISNIFTPPSNTVFNKLIRNIQVIKENGDCDAIKKAFLPYLNQKNPNKEEQEIKEMYEFLCEFTFVPKIENTQVDARYSLNLK